MSEQTLSHTLPVSSRIATAATAASYAILGSILCWTRFAGLDRSYWHDEIVAVAVYVRSGPREILAGTGLSHEFFSLLAWATTSLVGESEVTVRLCSAVPFVLGVVVATAWLHVRVGALTGVLFLFLATASPLLLDVTRQARGYGLGFLAMSVLIVCALEADRSGRTWPVLGSCAAGLIGTWTLPNFGVAFLATGAVLVTNSQLRRRAAVGLGASILMIGAWYAPHFDELRETAQWQYGAPIETLGVVTAPFDQILLPGLLQFDGKTPVSSVLWLPIVALVALPMSQSPLLRQRRTALVLCSGVVVTVVAVWVAGTYIVPRYLSFLLVPLLILLASGMGAILARPAGRPPILRTVAVLASLAVFAVAFVTSAVQVVRLPREAHKDAAAFIRDQTPTPSPVFAYMLEPGDIRFYLERPVKGGRTPEFVTRVCRNPRPAILVVDLWRLGPVHIPCGSEPEVRFEQYARGGEISVYFISGVP